MKITPYKTALSKFRKHCEKQFGYDTKSGNRRGVITEAGIHYGIGVSQMSEILLHSRGKVLTEKMLADIGLKRESVLIKK